MSNPTEKGIHNKNNWCKKLCCDQCGVCRYWDTIPYFRSRINHKHFGIYIQPEIEQKKRKLNRKTIYRGRDRIEMTDELYLCDDENILSNKDKLLTTGKLLGVEAITCNEIPNKGLNMTDREM